MKYVFHNDMLNDSAKSIPLDQKYFLIMRDVTAKSVSWLIVL